MKISKRAEYGLTAMVHLARGKTNKSVSIRQISNIEGLPFEFLAKIFSVLEKAKLIKAKYGANGGYILTKASNKISVNDVVSALEGNKKTVNCAFCQRKNKCSTKNVWAKLEISLTKTLEQVKLSDLI
jgi:Rrf2 family protein